MLIMDDARQFAEDLDHAGREYDLRLIRADLRGFENLVGL